MISAGFAENKTEIWLLIIRLHEIVFDLNIKILTFHMILFRVIFFALIFVLNDLFSVRPVQTICSGQLFSMSVHAAQQKYI